MREIKFRAWDREHLKMVDVIDFSCMNYPEKYIVMQYTGLKDKNGEMIWEGDIINAIDEDTRFGQPYKYVEVKFYNGEFCIECRMNGRLGLKYLTKIEVIGNIYQDSELLGANND